MGAFCEKVVDGFRCTAVLADLMHIAFKQHLPRRSWVILIIIIIIIHTFLYRHKVVTSVCRDGWRYLILVETVFLLTLSEN